MVVATGNTPVTGERGGNYHDGIAGAEVGVVVEEEEVFTAEQRAGNLSPHGKLGIAQRDIHYLVVNIFNLDPIIQQV